MDSFSYFSAQAAPPPQAFNIYGLPPTPAHSHTPQGEEFPNDATNVRSCDHYEGVPGPKKSIITDGSLAGPLRTLKFHLRQLPLRSLVSHRSATVAARITAK